MTHPRLSALRAHVERFDLDRHPFYVAWKMGTLPSAKLSTYAHEYGRFIGGALPAMWTAAGDPEHAAYEVAHARLWEDFSSAVDVKLQGTVAGGTTIPGALPQVDALCAMTEAFSTQPEVLGALYAFEAQQPTTAQTKLDGLRAHYAVGPLGEKYFTAHAGGLHETALLEEQLLQLDDAELDRAATACAMTAAGLWLALDGVLAA